MSNQPTPEPPAHGTPEPSSPQQQKDTGAAFLPIVQEPLATLWRALPSVQRYGEDFQLDAPAIADDLVALYAAVFKAVHTNADDADSTAAAERFAATLPPVPALSAEPPPLLDGAADGSEPQIGTVPRSYFEEVMTQHVAPAWLPPGEALMALRPQSATSPTKAADAGEASDKSPKKAKAGKVDKAKEAAEAAAAAAAAAEEAARAAVPVQQIHWAAQLEATVEAVVDDRPPRALLKLADVITLPIAKTLPVELKDFTRRAIHAAHPECYDIMWAGMMQHEGNKKGGATDDGEEETVSQETLAAWLLQWLGWCRDNLTANRARIAAKTHWLDAAATRGVVGFEEFHAAAKRAAALYTGEEPDKHFTEFVSAAAAAIGEQSSDLSRQLLTVAIAPRANRPPLKEVTELFVRDDLHVSRHETAVMRRATENRVFVTGLEGSGKSTFGRALAAKINAVFVDVYDLALEAVDAAGSGDDALGEQVRSLINADQPIPLALQAQLVSRCLRRPSTLHRGYVFADVPGVSNSNAAEVDEFLADCNFAEWATAVVKVRMPSELYAAWRNEARLAKLRVYEEELEIRQREADAEAAKAAAEAAKIEKKKIREARVERQAKIDAGEIEPTDDDKAFAEAGGLDSLEPEEEETSEVDEDGNALEPEQVAARRAAAESAVARRKLLAELHRQIHAGRHTDLEHEQLDPATLAAWRANIGLCVQRDRVVTVASFDDAAAAMDYAAERLRLERSVAPQRPNVPAEQLEGIEPGPDGDAQLADLHKAALEEQGIGMSPWENYCPVTKYESGVLVAGSWAFACHFRGFMYCFCSKAKLQRFMDSPLPYILQSTNNQHPVLLLPKTRSVLAQAGIDAARVEELLAERLNLTPSDMTEFHGTWTRFENEKDRRAKLEAARKAADAKALKSREDRLRKIREAADKKGKKPTADKKKKKDDGDAGAAEPAETAAAPEPADDEAPQVVTTEQRLQAEIDAAVKLRESRNIPHLVSCLSDISRDQLLELLERRQLPEMVVLLEYTKPRRDDDEEETGEEEAADDEEDAPPEPEVDEDGNPLPVKAKTPKPFDQNDEKMYRKLVAKLLEEFAISPDDEPPAPAAGNEEGGEPSAAPLPRQQFAVRPLNVFDMSAADVAAAIVRMVRPVVEKAALPQDGEDLAADDEADDAEPEDGSPRPNPLLVPGRKAIHQFGATLKYCPVTLHTTGVLVSGDPANWLSYMGGRYVFVSPEAMERFRLNPERFLPSVPPRLPAPRLWLLGVPVAGKRTLARGLGARFGIPVFDMGAASLVSYIAAASSPNGGEVDGVFVPPTDPATNKHLAEAIAIAHDLKEKEAAEAGKLREKEEALAAQAAREEAQANGDDVDDLEEDEEAEMQRKIEFEPEEEEAKAERVSRAQRRMAACLMRVEPFESRGYIVIDRPNSEVEVEQLLEFNAFPEACISLKLSSDAYVSRRCDAEFARRMDEYEAQMAVVKKQRRKLLLKQRQAEIEKWRRRNIGGGDEDADDEEPPEDPEAPQMDAVKGDLEGQFETEQAAVQAVLGVLPDKRIPVVEINGDWALDTVLRSTVAALSKNLLHRRSFLENPLVVTYKQAVELVESGRKFLSSFRFIDPVAVEQERAGAAPEVKIRPGGRGVEPEDVIPEPEPAPPKPKKMKTITKENEETGETEEVEVTDDEPDDDEDAAPVEEEEELEAEPDLSPEELEEMQAELDQKVRARAETKLKRACVLRNRVYFFDSEANLLKFLTESPLHFWDQPPPAPYVEPGVVAYMDDQAPSGPFTEAGRPRGMAHHLAYNLGAVFLDVPKVLKWATRQPALVTLKSEALRVMLSGEPIPAELLCTALACRLMCHDVASQGAVLSNLPRDEIQLDAMLRDRIVVHKVLVQPPNESPIIRTIDQLATVSHEMKFERFTNAALVESFEAVRRNLRNRQHLLMSRRLAFPSRIHDCSVPNDFLRNTRSVFKTYCPYTWTRENRLIDSLGDTTFAAEYCEEQFYFSQESHLAQFLECPHQFSGELGGLKALPTVLPSIVQDTAHIRSTDLEHAGCCPVTLYETRDRKGLKGITEPLAVLGSADHIVEYSGKKYALVNDEAVDKFLRQPWVYVDGAVLPLAHRMPFDKEDVKSLPTQLYIRRMVYEELARAMLACGETRPKFPGLSSRDSALKYIALHLKAHNAANTEHRQRCYEEGLAAFTERATLYKDIALEAPEAEAELAEFRRRCDVWDAVQDDTECWRAYQHPKPLTTPPEAE